MEVISPLSYDEKKWAMFCHLSALSGLVLPIPFASIIAPLIIWSIKKEESGFIDDQGKEALNFQISMMIYMLCCIPLVFIVIGIPLLAGLAILNVILVIIASVKANSGENYRYPLAMKLIQ